MKPLRKTSEKGRLGISPRLFGICCCIFSAVTYTGVNICLRFLSTQCDQTWVLFGKELVAVAVIGPWLLVQYGRGKPVFPGTRYLALLALLGFLVQWAGNLPCLWAFGVVGLSVSVPIYIGTNLAASAILSRILLGERISLQSVSAIALMCLSIVLLSMGAPHVNESIAAATGAKQSIFIVALAIAGLLLAGTIYAVLAVSIRYTVTGRASSAVLVFMITVMGSLTFGPWSIAQNGFDAIAAVPLGDQFVIFLSGVLNLVAFLALAKGMEITTVAHANVLSASQVAMSTLAGLMFFTEPPGPWLVIGVCLSIAGIIFMRPAVVEEAELTAGV